jgi:hypothetical protein
MSHPKSIVLFALCAVWLVGCAAAMPRVKPIRFSELTEQTMTQLPMVIQVEKGDQIPVKVSLRGNMLESPADAEPIMLTAKRRFFVVVRNDGLPRISLDGVTLGSYEKKGSLSLGIHQQDGGPAEVQVDLTQSYQSRN